MSVAVHDPVEYVDRDEAEQARHPRAVVWSAAAATLAVIAGPVIAAENNSHAQVIIFTT